MGNRVSVRKTAVSVVGIGLLFVTAIGVAQETAPQQADPQSAVLPLTTNSAQARRLVEAAWTLNLDQVEQAQAIEVLRRVIKIDPEFALAHEFLAQISLDPAEQVTEQQRAFATRSHASPAEQQIIEWWQDAADHKLISAITKMNDVLRQYPHDKWVVFLATWWLQNQTQYERSIAVYERSGITDSPGLMNNMGYSYAYMRQFDKAFALMDKYVAALPNDSNPQDSYAEILRMAGRFDQAIEHYQASLAINSQFYSSQFGIADTYSLMGDQARARKAYAIGFERFSLPELHRIQWQTREATTFIRERDYEGADHAFQDIADYAHSKQMSQVEADTYRQMGMYQPDPKRATLLLDKAETAVKEGKNSLRGALAQELAQILRARVELAVKMGNKKMMRSYLEQLTKLSESSDDRLIETAYHGAAGAVLSYEHKYKDAISHLEEDINNPLSLELLAVAYTKAGNNYDAKRVRETLLNLNDPTLEQAMVVPTFRKCNQDPACNGNVKSATAAH